MPDAARPPDDLRAAIALTRGGHPEQAIPLLDRLIESDPSCALALRERGYAKSFCGDAARFICDQGTQLHGGMGFTWGLGLHFYLRRTTLLEHAYGSATFHRRRLLDASLADLRVDY